MTSPNRYETTYIINAAIEENMIEDTIAKITEVVKEQNAEILKLDKVGRKRLAYPIQKKHSGFYVTMEYTAATTSVAIIERALQLDDYVLRFLTVLIDKKILGQREKDAKKVAYEKEAAEAVPTTPIQN
ncbi:MAG: 30S ribosomal protein S6 [Bacteroidetes bacterium]|jgi:small subunit ribosomal protein S6|nr:30S ribosomal protein S6 [Bacteroidota bacterium]MCA0447754.1 30S ribosomal protein S6 [Bacteroidota bacterium]